MNENPLIACNTKPSNLPRPYGEFIGISNGDLN